MPNIMPLSITKILKIQAALGFDYSWTQKPRKTRENYYFYPYLGLKWRFWYSLFVIYQERNPRE
jgi:hypothetical protein